MVTRVLKRCCQIFEEHALCCTKNPVDGIYFKATLFELDTTPQTGEILRRAYWHYPPFKIPITNEIPIKSHPNCTAVKCYLEKKLIIVEDVQEENKKEDSKYWEDSQRWPISGVSVHDLCAINVANPRWRPG